MPSTSDSHRPLAAFLARSRNELGLLLAIVLVVLMTLALDPARSYRVNPELNATNILRDTAMLGIFALGAAVVIISGGIDLSSGAVIAFSGAVCCSIILLLAPVDPNGMPITDDLSPSILAAAFAGTLLVGFLIGSFHAWLITSVGLPPFVATLATLVGLRSLAKVLVQEVTQSIPAIGRSTQIYVYDETFYALGNVWWIPLAIFLALSLLIWVLLSRTVVGRHIYAMGGNEQAARLSGIRTERLKWLAYCTGAVTASIAGIINSGYVQMSNPATQGLGYELNAIAAAVIGGCSLSGGVGTVAGTMLGALFLQVVIDSVAKTVKTNPDDYEGLIVGLLVVLAVAFNQLRQAGGLRRPFFPGALGVLNVAILALLAGTIAGFMSSENKLTTGAAIGGTVLVLLGAKKAFEVAASARQRRGAV